LEAFYAGVPVWLFFDGDRYEPLDEVRSIFEGLQRVGVFHLTPESAVSFLNENYNTIEDWWGMPDTKAAVDRVKNYFFNDSGDFVGEWTQELVSLRSRALKGELNL
jgi:putative transferase (TIGR04331 family)